MYVVHMYVFVAQQRIQNIKENFKRANSSAVCAIAGNVCCMCICATDVSAANRQQPIKHKISTIVHIDDEWI